MNGMVVVGYDETVAGERALAFAADEAALHGVPLEIVNVVPEPDKHSQSAAARALAEWITDEGGQTVRRLHPELSVMKCTAFGWPDEVLAGEAHEADLLVLGDRSHRDYCDLRDATVTVHALDLAVCPVLVLSPLDHGPRYQVTVAVNLDEPAGELLAFAYLEAARRHATLSVLKVCDDHAMLDYQAFDEDDMRTGAAVVADHVKHLEQAVAPWRARYPHVASDARVRTGSIGQTLIEHSGESDLLVVGSRRHPDGRPGMEVGPTVHALLHHADCPVAVVPIG